MCIRDRVIIFRGVKYKYNKHAGVQPEGSGLQKRTGKRSIPRRRPQKSCFLHTYTPFVKLDDTDKDAKVDTKAADWTIFVGRLPKNTTQEELNQHFTKYGKIVRTNFVTDTCSGEFKGYCFVEYKHRADARRAYRELSGRRLRKGDLKTVLVDVVRGGVQKGWKPRRLGGGYGGSIKSSQLRFGGREQPYIPVKRQIQSKR
eukprot:TRINITY_DN5104_c0_g1_i5.p1 TRINITY_DN5104_c0_g1~~TRINITY_DN5104_c0_g1_i5.p1  ORF type:complete len:201 (+),score=30.10 TRINITY_DN5104_c0_g1_i5:69-671(+)